MFGVVVLDTKTDEVSEVLEVSSVTSTVEAYDYQERDVLFWP